MSMGLESKEGALRALGEQFPNEKLAEIRSELREDAESEGALNLVKVQIQKQIMDMTGMMAGPDGSATPVDPMMMGDGDVLGDGILGPQSKKPDPNDAASAAENSNAETQIRNTLLTQAYGDRPPAKRTVDKD